ncbi:hypothetical protein OG809_22795 [Kribbella soli]
MRAGLIAWSAERTRALVDGGVYLIGVHRPGATVTVDVRSGLLGTRKKLQRVYLGSIDIKRDLLLYGELHLEGRRRHDRDRVDRQAAGVFGRRPGAPQRGVSRAALLRHCSVEA